MKTPLLQFSAFAITLFLTGAALAQEPDRKAAAEGLFDEGLRLFDAGQYAEACAKFEASERLDAGAGTLLNLARCLEKSGKTASAWLTYREAQALARKDGDAPREQAARAHEMALANHVSKIVITVPSNAIVPGLVIKRDGVAIDRAEWGVPVAIDPGPHDIDVSAPERRGRSRTVVVESEAQTTDTILPLESLLLNATPTTTARASTTHDLRRPFAIVAGAVGLLGAGAGTYFGLDAASKWSDAKSHCPPGGRCDAQGASLSRDAGTAADLSTMGFVVCAAALVGGAVLWLTAPSSRPVDPNKIGLQVGGSGAIRLNF